MLEDTPQRDRAPSGRHRMPRLFTALEIPDHARVRLAALRAPFVRARWVQPEDYHITLRFLGDITRKQADEHANRDRIACVPITIPFVEGEGLP